VRLWARTTSDYSNAFTRAGDGAAVFRHACGLGLEGIVSKRVGSRYVSGIEDEESKSSAEQFRAGDSDEKRMVGMAAVS
jgi:ATP-dependent DNA ligase